MAQLMFAFAVVWAVAACAGPGGASPRGSVGATVSPASTPRDPELPGGTSPPVTGIPQDLLDQMLQQASELSSVQVSELTIDKAEAVTWPDGSLGCPEPGMMYTQVLVDGYWAVIRAGEETYDFRGSGSDFRLCPPGRGNPPARDGETQPDLYY